MNMTQEVQILGKVGFVSSAFHIFCKLRKSDLLLVWFFSVRLVMVLLHASVGLKDKLNRITTRQEQTYIDGVFKLAL